MKWSPESEKRILAALGERLKGRSIGACAICGQTTWQMLAKFVTITVTDDPAVQQIGGPNLPCLVLLCKTCGNVHLLNLLVLGLEDLVKEEEDAAKAKPDVE